MGRGRLSKEEKSKPISPENQADADLFMETIGKNYETLKVGCRANQLKANKPWSEDAFQDTVVLCYETIQRRGIRDKSDQGIRNYFFNAFKMNVLHEAVLPYNSRKVDDEELVNNYDPLDERDGEQKVKEQLFNDFAVMRLLEMAECNVDSLSFYCFRLKNLLPKVSFHKLVKLTKIKNAKARCKSVADWLKANVTEEELRKEFEEKYLE